MARRGWFKLYRQIQEHWTWKKKPASEGQAMVDIFIRTNWIDSEMLNPKVASAIKVRKGEAICSVRGLAEAWGWSRNRTQTFLLRLQIEGTIKATNEATHTRLKVLNWKKYQGNDKEKGPDKGPGSKPHAGPRKGRKRGTSENHDKGKETNPQTPEREAAVGRLTQVIGLIEDGDTRDVFLEFLTTLDADTAVATGDMVDRVNHAMNAREQLKLHPGAPFERMIRYALDATMKGKARSSAYTDTVIQNALVRWRDGKSFE